MNLSKNFLTYFLRHIIPSLPSSTPLGYAQLQYVEAFDSEFTLLLSEITSASLADMMKDAIEVEVNLSTYINKKRDVGEWRREEEDRRNEKESEQPSSSSTQESRMDTTMRAMERLMERLSVGGKPPPRKNQEQ